MNKSKSDLLQASSIQMFGDVKKTQAGPRQTWSIFRLENLQKNQN